MSNHQCGEGRLIEESWFGQSPEGMVLLGSKCESCGKVSFPKKYVCPDCFGDKLKTVPLSKKGKLHTYAVSIMGPPEMEKPYVVGFIDLPEKIMLFSMLTDCGPVEKTEKTLKIGMEMEMVFGKIRKDKSGQDIISYKFRPVERR